MKIIIQICDFLPATPKWRDCNQVDDTIVGAGGDSRFGEQILFWYHSPPLSGTRALKWVELNFINKYYQIFCLNTISLPDPSFCGLVSVTLIVVVYLPPLISSQSAAVDSSTVASPLCLPLRGCSILHLPPLHLIAETGPQCCVGLIHLHSASLPASPTACCIRPAGLYYGLIRLLQLPRIYMSWMENIMQFYFCKPAVPFV